MGKMKRLVSALLAVLMLITCVVVFAEPKNNGIPMKDLDMDTYNVLLAKAKDQRNKQIFEKYYREVLAQKTATQRSNLLASWAAAGTITGYKEVTFEEFFAYCRETHGAEGKICTCAAFVPFNAEGHEENCPWNQGNFEPMKIEGGVNGASVSVAGDLPETAVLTLESATLEEVRALVPDVTDEDGIIYNPLNGFEGNKRIIMDLSVMDDSQEWQPEEGQSVSVTMDVSSIGKNGDPMLVYHVHVNEDGSVGLPEFIGEYTMRDGKISFDMDKFSYVLVFSGKETYSITDLSVFYKALDAESGNGHYQFLGVYYDSSENLHLLLATLDITPQDAEKHFKSCYIDGKQYIISTMGDRVKKIDVSTFSKVQFKDDKGRVLATVDIVGNKGIAKGFYDVNLGDQKIKESFEFAVSQDNNPPSGSNAWNVEGVVSLDLDYEISKTVATGTTAVGATFSDSVTVDRGDWVIFWINVKNNGDRRLTGITATDILPSNVFKSSTVEMGKGDFEGNVQNWEPFKQDLFGTFDCEGNFERKVYIKAQVDPDLNITSQETFTNMATISGDNMPEDNVSANVIVKQPQVGTLTVSKQVTSENPNDPPDPDTEFEFKISHSDSSKTSFNYKIDGVSANVENGGIIKLKNGKSAVFVGFPTGDYTVTEITKSGYTTKVNGETPSADDEGNYIFAGNMTSLASPVVAFENKFKMRTNDLTIKKSLQDGEIPTAGDFFKFIVYINDGQEEHGTYTYSIDSTDYTIIGDGRPTDISIEAGQSVDIEALPLGTTYTVTEDLTGVTKYKFVSATTKDGTSGETVPSTSPTVTGTIALGGSTAEFVNGYNLTDLTVSKEWIGNHKNTSADSESALVNVVVDGTTYKLALSSGNGYSETITGLIVGKTFTVNEDTGWTWRYGEPTVTCSNNGVLQASGNTAKISNTYSDDYWLGGDNYAVNTFGEGTASTSGTPEGGEQ